MSSLRRIESSRANGATSRGPVTPEGKRRSSQNAITHGLLAGSALLQDESPELFERLFFQHIDRLQPVDDVERGFIEEMVMAHWRMRRGWAVETQTLQSQISAQASSTPLEQLTGAFTDLNDSHRFALLQRYETRLHLMYQRALKHLLLLRAAAPPPAENCVIPNEPSPISEHGQEPLALAPATQEMVDPQPGSIVPSPFRDSK